MPVPVLSNERHPSGRPAAIRRTPVRVRPIQSSNRSRLAVDSASPTAIRSSVRAIAAGEVLFSVVPGGITLISGS